MWWNYPASAAPFLWAGMPRTPEVTERTEPALPCRYTSVSHVDNRFGVVRRKPPTRWFGSFGLVTQSNHPRTDAHDRDYLHQEHR